VPDSTPKLDTQGRALVAWTLGDSAGNQVLEVRVAGVDSMVRVTARATAGAPSRILLKEEIGKPGAPIGLTATVTDAYGNPVDKAPVSFSATAGKLSAPKGTTDQSGRLVTRWSPSTKPGTQTVTARLGTAKVSTSYSWTAPAAPSAALSTKRRQ
jgi:hypothetical protein